MQLGPELTPRREDLPGGLERLDTLVFQVGGRGERAHAVTQPREIEQLLALGRERRLIEEGCTTGEGRGGSVPRGGAAEGGGVAQEEGGGRGSARRSERGGEEQQHAPAHDRYG